MSQEIDLREGEWPNTASVPPLPLSRKRPRETEELSNEFHLCNESGPRDKTVTSSAEFVVDLEHNKKRRGVVKIEPSGKNDAAGECVQNLKGDHATEKDDCSEDGEIAEHRESHEGIQIAVAVSQPMISDLKQTSRKDGSANKHSQKLSTFKAPSKESGRQSKVSAWEDRLGDLAGYRKINGHCNVPRNSETSKLATWVAGQRRSYRLHQEGKTSSMTLSRIQALESLGLEWKITGTAWGDRLSELADYRKIHGHCNVPVRYRKNTKLAMWVANQRRSYRLQAEGKKSQMTLSRIQELESLGFEWNIHDATWENYLSELADYRKIHGHCNVFCSQNAKLAYWVRRQRKQYQLLLEGKKLPMTLNQIQQLESLGIDWKVCVTTWQDRLSELADYRKIHGHCNVPQKYPQLGSWVETQRGQYRMHLEGKASKMTTFRIKALESLGFEWHVTWATWEDRLSELADYRKIHGNCNVPRNYNKNVKLATWVGNQRAQYRWKLEGKTSTMTLSRIQQMESLGFEWDSRGAAWEVRLSELVDYRKIHGHCNVPKTYYKKNTQLGQWVAYQRINYKLHLEGKASPITLSRIHALETQGFQW
jgi:hypothetical protein